MSTQNCICSLCEEGHLHSRIDQNEVEYKGHKRKIPVYYSECDFCGSEQADATQTRDNKRAMLAFKKEVDGLLTGRQIKELRNHLDLSQARAAEIFGGGPVAFSKYENDDVMQSEAMDKLLRLAGAIPDAFNYLKALQVGAETALESESSAREEGYVSSGIKPEVEKKAKRYPNLRVIDCRRIDEPSTYIHTRTNELSLRHGT